MDQRANADNGDTAFTLETFLPYRLVRIAERVSREFAENYRQKYGLSRPEWRCLATLGQFGTVTSKEIGESTTMHKTKVSRAVAELERRGWLKRRPDPQDRRAEQLTLTAAGRKAFRELVPLADAFEASLHGSLGRNAASQLLSGLDRLERHYRLPPHDR
jgi:DNA-binding MarR family transcriptional regulator